MVYYKINAPLGSWKLEHIGYVIYILSMTSDNFLNIDKKALLIVLNMT